MVAGADTDGQVRRLARREPAALARALLARAVATRGAGFGLLVVSVVLLVALGADVIAPYGPNQMQPAGILAAPSLAHWLGTDQLGRDVLSRIVYGRARRSRPASSRWDSRCWRACSWDSWRATTAAGRTTC